jgi:hypothetical protein
MTKNNDEADDGKTEYERYSDKIDYRALKWLLGNMQPHHILFKMIKAEMEQRGHWKAKPRGQGFQKGYDPNRRVLQAVDEKEIEAAVEEVEREAEEAAKRLVELEVKSKPVLRRKKG